MIKDYANKVMDYEYNAFMSLMNVSVSKHLFDEHFTVLWANDYFYELIGYSKEEYEKIFHNHVDEYYKDDPASVANMAKIIVDAYNNKEAGYEFECPMPTKNGKTAWIRVTGRFTDEEFDGIPVIYTIYTNITKLKELQSRLGDALDLAERANHAKSEFLSQMSHDIRTPMNAIIGMTSIAAMHIDDKQKVRDCLKKISASGQHLLGLINDVLDMSKIESGNITLHKENVCLPAVIENVVSIMQPLIRDKCQHFSVRLLNVSHENYVCDSLRLRQILINVLSNASKFTPSDGTITFEIHERAADSSGRATIGFICSDTGVGIRPDFIPHLFDAFTRERDGRVDKTEGSGLGLAITKKLLDLLSGTIAVESRVGQGTTFTIEIPLEITSPPAPMPDCAGLKMLVVDNDEISCEYLVQTLRELGVEASWSVSGNEATQKVMQAYRAGKNFDMILLDWKMPEMDGIETARKIHEFVDTKIPILIASAYDWADIETEALKAGINGFLQKPLFKSTLCNGIQRYIYERETHTPQRELQRLDGKRILIAEDNELNREIAVELLSAMGAETETAADGALTIEAFAQAAAGYYDLILMDIQMPNVNGYDAARRIRALPREEAKTIPIIALTAEAFAENVIMAENAGIDSHLSKPFDVITLNREICKYLK